MSAQPAPELRPSRTQLKFQICQAIQRLTNGPIPADWQSWDSLKTSEFLSDVQGCHTGRSLAGLVISAKNVAQAYGHDPRRILPAEVFE